MNKNWNKYVDEARKVVTLLRLQNKHRMKVAEIAIKACTIKHGGRAQVDRPTVKLFAERIGIAPKTLYEWIRHKRLVFDKLNDDQKIQFQEISANTIKGIITGLEEGTEKGKVQNKFSEYAGKAPIIAKLDKYLAVLNTIIYNLSAYMRIKEVPDETLTELIRRSNMIINFAEKELELREIGVPETVKKPKIDWDNFWSEEVGLQ